MFSDDYDEYDYLRSEQAGQEYCQLLWLRDATETSQEDFVEACMDLHEAAATEDGPWQEGRYNISEIIMGNVTRLVTELLARRPEPTTEFEPTVYSPTTDDPGVPSGTWWALIGAGLAAVPWSCLMYIICKKLYGKY